MTSEPREDNGWTEQALLEILLNPIYTMGSKPIVPDSQWIAAQKELLEEVGEQAYLEQLLRVIKSTFSQFVA